VFFDNVQVPVANLVGEEGRGWDCAKFLLASERTGIANVGPCWERLDHAHEFAARTQRGGKPLIDEPKLRAELATLGAEIRALELTNWRFLLNPDIARTNPGFASVLKLKGTELTQELTSLLARLAGPAGLERREDGQGSAAVSRYLFYRACTIYGGSSEVQKDILAKTLLG
jgi:pimeloyl-CoA dehydrogenase